MIFFCKGKGKVELANSSHGATIKCLIREGKVGVIVAVWLKWHKVNLLFPFKIIPPEYNPSLL